MAISFASREVFAPPPDALTPGRAEMCVPQHRNSMGKSTLGYKCAVKNTKCGFVLRKRGNQTFPLLMQSGLVSDAATVLYDAFI